MSAHEALRNKWLLGKATRNENLESCLLSLLNLTMYEYVIKNKDSEDQAHENKEQLAQDDEQNLNDSIN